MTDNCRFTGSSQPRLITGRHEPDCTDESCRGCQHCEEPHCRICGRTHTPGACAECTATTRANLHEIARLCNALPDEVEHRGIDGEAMMLLAPAANPEARGHLEASVLAGRISREAIETTHLAGCDHPDCLGCAGELHPDFTLGAWESAWREALDHTDPTTRFDLPTTVDYLDRTLTYMAGYPHVDFADFARDLRRCVTHLEAVLHDGEQHDRGAPCMSCRVPLERVWGDNKQTDGWRCPRCLESSTEDQYRYAVMHLHREEATHLTDREMEMRTGVKAGTVRVWARRGEVERKRDQGRTVYAVADVLRRSSAS